MRFHTCIWVGGGGQDIGLKFFGTGGQVMGHTDAFIQPHRVVQLLITIPRLAKPPFVQQKARHCASRKAASKCRTLKCSLF